MVYLHREKGKRKRKKRKQQKRKKRNKERKVVEKEDKIYKTIQEQIDDAVAYLEKCDTIEKEDDQKEKTTADSVVPRRARYLYIPENIVMPISSIRRLISSMGGTLWEVQHIGMQIYRTQMYNCTGVGARLRLRCSVHPRRLIEGPAVSTLADVYLYYKLESLGIYRRNGEVLLAMRKEESGFFELDCKMTVSNNAETTLIDKTSHFAKIAWTQVYPECDDPECPWNNGMDGPCTGNLTRKQCDGWVRWKYFEMPEFAYTSDWSVQGGCLSEQE